LIQKLHTSTFEEIIFGFPIQHIQDVKVISKMMGQTIIKIKQQKERILSLLGHPKQH